MYQVKLTQEQYCCSWERNITQGLSNEVFVSSHPWVLLLTRHLEVCPNRRKCAFREGVIRQECFRHRGCLKGQYATNKILFCFLNESCKDNPMESKNTNIKQEIIMIDPPISGFRISQTSSYIFTWMTMMFVVIGEEGGERHQHDSPFSLSVNSYTAVTSLLTSKNHFISPCG